MPEQPAEIGDIVRVTARPSERWVFRATSGSPWGRPRYAHLARRSGKIWVGLSVAESDLSVVDRPVYTVGQRVRIDGMGAEVIAIEPEQIAGEARVRVRLDPYRRPLAGGGSLRRPGDEVSAPTWKLALDGL